MAEWKSTLELGDLIVKTPSLLAEIERLVVDGWLLMPRGSRVRLRKAIERVKEHQAKASTDVRVAELADAPPVRTPTGAEGSNPSTNDSPEAA